MSGKIRLDIQVRFRDLDAMGHVNNATFLTYFEEGRKEFFARVLKSTSLKDFPFILAQVVCRYHHPIELRDQVVREAIWISSIGGKSFSFAYEIYKRDGPEWIFATGESVQVFYDYEKGISYKIPEEFRRAVSPYIHPSSEEHKGKLV